MFRCLSARMLGLDLSPRSVIELAARAGFQGVELPVRDVVERGDRPEELAALRQGLGLRGATWPLPVAWRGDEADFRRDLGRLPGLARVAARLGLDRTGTWVPPEAPAGSPVVEALGRVIDRLSAIADVLGGSGQRLGLEAIGVRSFRTGRGPVLVERTAGLGPILDALRDRGHDVGVVVDAFHLHAARESIDDALRRGPAAITSVHLADVPAGDPPDPDARIDHRRALPGDGGIIPCADWLGRLAEAGYDGPVLVEPRPAGHPPASPDDAEAIVEAAAIALDRIWPRLGPAA